MKKIYLFSLYWYIGLDHIHIPYIDYFPSTLNPSPWTFIILFKIKLFPELYYPDNVTNDKFPLYYYKIYNKHIITVSTSLFNSNTPYFLILINYIGLPYSSYNSLVKAVIF